jgi:ketosteroid isomerase-like protein
MPPDLTQRVRDYFRAYETGERALIEGLMADGFSFTSPFDDAIGRDAYFRRCWPNNTSHRRFDIEFLAQDGETVTVVYVANMATGNPVHPTASFRNAECHAFENGRLKAVTVFFGDPPGGLTRRQFSEQSGAG